jgi:cation diffusion facilitator family transporter
MTARPPSPARYAWWSIVAAIATMVLKGVAWLATGSVGLFADALESGVNLAAAAFALWVLRVAARPPDERHAYGHEKAEYFASGAEGMLITLAALSIAVSAGERLFHPRPIEQLGLGIAALVAAALVNLGMGLALRSAGRRLHSIALQANGAHLLTDVWTSAGVLVALVLVHVTGWQLFDPLIALAVAVQIAWTGLRLTGKSVSGLMDQALPARHMKEVVDVLESCCAGEHEEGDEVRYHALRSRRSGRRSFVSVHIQVPGHWTVQRGHDLLESIEEEIRRRVPRTSVFTHLEPVEDPVSYADEELDRDLYG